MIMVKQKTRQVLKMTHETGTYRVIKEYGKANPFTVKREHSHTNTIGHFPDMTAALQRIIEAISGGRLYGV